MEEDATCGSWPLFALFFRRLTSTKCPLARFKHFTRSANALVSRSKSVRMAVAASGGEGDGDDLAPLVGDAADTSGGVSDEDGNDGRGGGAAFRRVVVRIKDAAPGRQALNAPTSIRAYRCISLSHRRSACPFVRSSLSPSLPPSLRLEHASFDRAWHSLETLQVPPLSTALDILPDSNRCANTHKSVFLCAHTHTCVFMRALTGGTQAAAPRAQQPS